MTKYTYSCDECGAENGIVPAVVELCHEYVDRCGECGNRQAFNFSTAP